MDRFLSITSRRGIGVIPVFFHRVWHPLLHAGPQPRPEPGLYDA